MIVKGCEKRVIVVKALDSKYFEEAQFVIKAEQKKPNDDIIGEAKRLIDEVYKKKQHRTRNPFWIPFLCGAVSAAIICGGILLFVV